MNPFGFNAEEYIAKNGLVTDKAIAIELLCQTSLAWGVLDESLKSDSEVIMYYQPMGYFYQDEREYDQVTEQFETSGNYVYFNEKGFTGVGLITYDRPFMAPVIQLPEDFDYGTYFEIQRNLGNQFLTYNGDLDGTTIAGAKNFFTECANPEDHLTESASQENVIPGCFGLTYIIYDRSRLKTIVGEKLQTKTASKN